MDQIDFTSFFQTKAQANDFSSRLAAIAEKTYITTFNLEKTLTEQFGLLKKDALMSLLRDNNVSIDSPKSVKEFIQKSQETITKLQVVPITLAFVPNDRTLKTLSEWFMINMKRQVLFDITVDHRLIAGAAITYNGKYKDFSIKQKVFDSISKALAKPVPTNALPGKTPDTNAMHVGR